MCTYEHSAVYALGAVGAGSKLADGTHCCVCFGASATTAAQTAEETVREAAAGVEKQKRPIVMLRSAINNNFLRFHSEGNIAGSEKWLAAVKVNGLFII